MQQAEQAPATERPHRPSLLLQVALVLAFYFLYSFTRNLFGSSLVDEGGQPRQAFDHALQVIRAEQWLHIFREQTIQGWFLPYRWFIRFWNIYYGSFHFIVTAIALVWMYIRMPQRFVKWRNVLGLTTALALVGFSLFPLMPPRLVNAPPPYGGQQLALERGTPDYGFVDTLDTYGGLWSFGSGPVAHLSNQYAAMPSLHCAWAVWCTFVMWPLVRRSWAKALLVALPDGHVVLHRGHRQPLLRRHGGRHDLPRPRLRRWPRLLDDWHETAALAQPTQLTAGPWKAL